MTDTLIHFGWLPEEPDWAMRLDGEARGEAGRVFRCGVIAIVILVNSMPGGSSSWIHGSFRPTPKNEIVRDHYSKLGFDESEQQEGETRWVLPLDRFRAAPVSMTIFEGTP